jgi:hypothetical protein
MSDEDLAKFLGLAPDEVWCLRKLAPDKRAAYERMAEVYDEIVLWEAGVGKKPSGVILCGKRQVRGAGA